MKVYVIMHNGVGGDPYPEMVFKNQYMAWEYLKANPSSEIVTRTVDEVYWSEE